MDESLSDGWLDDSFGIGMAALAGMIRMVMPLKTIGNHES